MGSKTPAFRQAVFNTAIEKIGKIRCMTEYRKGLHTVYDIKYHVVWVTKYRKAILRGEIGLRLRELIKQTCAAMDVYILKGHISKDHVHLLLSVPPQVSVSDLIQRLKGRSSRKMLEEFGELRRQYWGQHLWARGYFVASTGNVTDEVIAQYIEMQDEMPASGEENFRVGEL
jgi:putative transposase